MSATSLESFAERVRGKRRIGKYDVQALQREILKGGLASRSEADLLIALDREVESLHVSWPSFFIATLADFVVWGSGRPGYVDEDKSIWVRSALAGEGATNRATRALVAIAKEAECFDEAFFATLEEGGPKRHVYPQGETAVAA